MKPRRIASRGIGRLVRLAIAIGVGLASVLMPVAPGGVSPVALAQGPARATSAPTSPWGKPVAPSRRIGVSTGQEVRTNLLPATLRTAPTVQLPRLVRDPATYAAAKAQSRASVDGVAPAAGVGGGAAAVPALAASPAAAASPFTGAFFDGEPGDRTCCLVPEMTFATVTVINQANGFLPFTVTD